MARLNLLPRLARGSFGRLRFIAPTMRRSEPRATRLGCSTTAFTLLVFIVRGRWTYRWKASSLRTIFCHSRSTSIAPLRFAARAASHMSAFCALAIAARARSHASLFGDSPAYQSVTSFNAASRSGAARMIRSLRHTRHSPTCFVSRPHSEHGRAEPPSGVNPAVRGSVCVSFGMVTLLVVLRRIHSPGR
jgi:hypothetical protein